jgi:hypothetical protein
MAICAVRPRKVCSYHRRLSFRCCSPDDEQRCLGTDADLVPALPVINIFDPLPNFSARSRLATDTAANKSEGRI